MKSHRRSLARLAVSLVSLPIFLGLGSCFPVPIGDPETSRVDPDLSGMWIVDGGGVILFEPFDKRTWLLTHAEIVLNTESCPDIKKADDTEVDPYTQLVAKMGRYNKSCFSAKRVELFKAWRTKLGGEWFMTWERKGSYSEDTGFDARFWHVFRIEKAGPDKFFLWWLDPEYDGFDDLKAYHAIMDQDFPYDPKLLSKARREVERVIRRNADDPKLHGEPEENEDGELLEPDPSLLQRAQPEHLNQFSAILEDVVSSGNK